MEMPQCVGRTTAVLFSSLHGIEFAHFCYFPAPNTLGNTELHSETQAHCSQIIRLLLLAGSGARDGWEPKGKSPKGRAAMAGLACGREPWQPWGSGAAAAARLGRRGGWSAGQLRRALSLAAEHLGGTAAAVSPAHASEQEASRHLAADLWAPLCCAFLVPAGFCWLYACLTPAKISSNFAFIEIVIPEPPRGNINRQCQTTWYSVFRRLHRLVHTAEGSNSGCIYCCSVTLTGPSNLPVCWLAQLGNTGCDGGQFPFGKRVEMLQRGKQMFLQSYCSLKRIITFTTENYQL